MGSGHSQLMDRLMEGFSSCSDEVKNAAAFALGNIAAGNLHFYLPHLLGQIKSSQHKYLMLYALKDMVSACSANATSLAEHVDQMLPCLFNFAERDDEGMRNVVAECLGKLAAVATKFDEFVRSMLRGGIHGEKYAAIIAEEQMQP